MQVLVPCKGILSGKSRLHGCIDLSERRELCEKLLVDTLRVALRVACPECIYVVTSDAVANRIADHQAVRMFPDTGAGMNEALEAARDSLRGLRNLELLVLPIDLPYLDESAIADVLAADADVVIAPDWRAQGTNILLMRNAAAHALPFNFGDRSFDRHMESARRIGASSCVIRDWRLASDIDEPAQYFQWRKHCRSAEMQWHSDRASKLTVGR